MNELADWCAESFVQCYVLKKPLIEVKADYEDCDGYAIFIPKRKLFFINFDPADTDSFDEFVDEFIEDIGYISNKYRYKGQIGRPKKWKDDLVYCCEDGESIDLEEFLDLTEIDEESERRVSELLVSLVTGSINDIDRVGTDVPENDLDRIKRNILLFDGDQTRFVYQGFDQSQVRIQGLSGTGKTELLLHKLKELYVASSSSRIIMTCHNKILAENLRRRIPDFFNFMKVEQQIEWDKRLLCVNAWGSQSLPNSGAYTAICNHYGLPFYAFSSSTNFEKACSLSLQVLKGKLGEIEGDHVFDYMLIDESQDFSESFFELCRIATSGTVYIAGDIFQSIFDQMDEVGGKPQFILSKCYRTAPATLMFAQALGMGFFEERKLNWLDKNDLQACGYIDEYDKKTGDLILRREPISRFEDMEDETDSVELVRIDAPYQNNCGSEILRKIEEIRESFPNVSPDDIGVILVDRGDAPYKIADYLAVAIPREFGWEVNKAYESRQKVADKIFVSNVNHVKGLEFPFVICATSTLSTSFNHRNALYMAITRSFLKTYLMILDSTAYSSSISLIENGLRSILDEGVLRVTPPPKDEQEEIKAKVRWHGTLKTSEDLVREILVELKVPKRTHAKIFYTVTQFLTPEADKERIRDFIITLLKG